MLEEPRNKLETEGTRPERQEGQLLKKRKWPLKGWHKVGVGKAEGRSRDGPCGHDGARGGCVDCVFPHTPFPVCNLGGPHRDTSCWKTGSFTMRLHGKT